MSVQFDRIAGDFESAWNSGEKPSIARFLDLVDDRERDGLLPRLLLIDIDQRIQAGDRVVAEDYAEFGAEAIKRAQHLLDEDSRQDLKAASLSMTNQGECVTIAQALDASTGPIAKHIGPYKLLQQIGEGGMGTVWMALQEHPVRRRVALKLIRGEVGSKDATARFEAERQALAMMDHHNIAKVLDAGTTPSGSPYFVMELIKGIPITHYCDKNQLSIRERLELLIPVCMAVQHAHQKGIIHRDLKPSNVLVTLSDGKPLPKVIDFGLAKALEQQTKLTDKSMLTEFGQVVGTVQYMSPEQAEMSPLDVDTRTDVYSLGVVLYELLTGTTPLDKETLGKNALLQVLAMIREVEPPRPSARLSSSGDAITRVSKQRQIAPAKLQQILRGELDWVVMKALEKDRTRRYETASSLADDIQNYLDGNAVEARPTSSVYRLQKVVRKHKAAFLSAATFLFLLIAGLIGTGAMWLRASQAKTDTKLALTDVQTQRLAAVAESVKAKAAEEKAMKEADIARAAEERERSARERMEAEKERAEATSARSKFFLATARWDANRFADANRLLYQIPEKYRHVEWGFANREHQGGYATCYGHRDAINGVCFSPDGKRIASASDDMAIKIWDASSGDELKTFQGHTWPVNCVTFSPDGRQIASGSDDGTVKIWEASSGKVLRTLIAGSNDGMIKPWDRSQLASNLEEFKTREQVGRWAVNCVSFSPDGQRIVSGSADKMVKLWDANTGEELKTFKGHSLSVQCVSFSPAGNQIVSGSGEGYISNVRKTDGIKIWDASTGEELRTLLGHAEAIMYVSFSPDGALIASASDDKTIKLWDVVSGEELRTLQGHENGVLTLRFSPDGKQVASGCGVCAKLWNVLFGYMIKELKEFNGRTNGISCICFSPDGARLASGGYDNEIKLWDATASEGNFRAWTGHEQRVSSVSISPNGAQIASASQDQTVKLWDAASGEHLGTFKGHADTVNSVSFSPDGASIVTGSSDKTMKVWDVLTFKEIKSLIGHAKSVSHACFNPDGTLIASCSPDNTIKIWNATSGKELRIIKEAFPSSMASPLKSCRVSFNRDGTRILSLSIGGWAIKLWNVSTGEELISLVGHPFTSACFSPDGTMIAASTGTTIKLWDAASGDEIRTLLGYNVEINSLSFSSDGSRIASGSYGKINLWDTASGEELMTIPSQGQNTSVYFSPDATRIVADGSNGAIRVWDVAGEEVRTLSGYKGKVECVSISPDGKLVAAGAGNLVKSWDASTGEQLKAWNVPSGRISSVSFSADGTRLYCDAPEKIVWNTESGQAIENADWTVAESPQNKSSNGRWQVIPSGDQVLLIDLWFKHTTAEKSFRAFKAKSKRDWLNQSASDANLEKFYLFKTNDQLWLTVREPDAKDKDYENALRQIQRVVRLDPANGAYLNTLGVAQFRLGDNKSAFETLSRSYAITTKSSGQSSIVDLVFLAMTNQRLGNVDIARDQLQRVRKGSQQPPWDTDSELRLFVQEAEALIQSDSDQKANAVNPARQETSTQK